MKLDHEPYFIITEKGEEWLEEREKKRRRRWSIALSLCSLVLAICSLLAALQAITVRNNCY